MSPLSPRAIKIIVWVVIIGLVLTTGAKVLFGLGTSHNGLLNGGVNSSKHLY